MPRVKKKYTGEFKQKVIEDMRQNDLGIREAARKYGVIHSTVLTWERIYLEHGVEGLYLESKSRVANGGSRVGRPPKLDKKAEEDLIAENQRLRMEVDYLKKLNALVQQEQLSVKKLR
jgi:transposase